MKTRKAFVIFLAFDIQYVVRYESGNVHYVSRNGEAKEMFINIINIFAKIINLKTKRQ